MLESAEVAFNSPIREVRLFTGSVKMCLANVKSDITILGPTAFAVNGD